MEPTGSIEKIAVGQPDGSVRADVGDYAVVDPNIFLEQ
jgi:hypothetical protein